MPPPKLMSREINSVIHIELCPRGPLSAEVRRQLEGKGKPLKGQGLGVESARRKRLTGLRRGHTIAIRNRLEVGR